MIPQVHIELNAGPSFWDSGEFTQSGPIYSRKYKYASMWRGVLRRGHISVKRFGAKIPKNALPRAPELCPVGRKTSVPTTSCNCKPAPPFVVEALCEE
jgi:hypothetical protein